MRNYKKSLPMMLLIVMLMVAISPVNAQGDEGKVVVAPGNTIKIAIVTDLTGPIAPMGLDIRQSGELAVMDMNAAGGVEGFMFEAIVEDDHCDGAEGTTVANRIASNPEIVAVAGHSCSTPTLPASEIYEEARLPMMSPSATLASLTTRGFDVVNRVSISDAKQGATDANYMYKILGIRKLAVVHDASAYGLGLAEVVRDTFTDLGGEVVAFESIATTDQDYRPVLTQIVGATPEALFFGGYQEQAILLATQMTDVGLDDVIFFSDDGTQVDEFINGSGDAAEGAYASVGKADVKDEEWDARYEEQFGVLPDELGPYHYNSYDATMLLMNGVAEVAVLDDAGNLVIDREELIDAVRNTTDYQGVTGVLTCDEFGDCGVGQILIFVVEDGAWVPVEVPEDLLTMEAE